MSLYLYYSISANLTEDDIVEIDEKVSKNQKAVSSLKKAILRLKNKTKKVVIHGIFLFQAAQPLAPYVYSIAMPLAPISFSGSSLEQSYKLLSDKKNYPTIAHIIEEKIDNITLSDEQFKKFNDLAEELNNGVITVEEAILKLRGGSLLDVATILAFVIFVNWYDSFFGINAFEPPPFLDPFRWITGRYDKPKTNNSTNITQPQCFPSRFDREMIHTITRMCDSSADESGFIMTYEDAYNLIKETYIGSLQISEGCSLSSWQTIKKAYHFQKGFNVDLGKYTEICKEDLVTLQHTRGGLIPYVRKGGKLPSIEFVKECQEKVKEFCELEGTKMKDAVHLGNGLETPAIMYYNDEERRIVLFNKTSTDMITTEKYRKSYYDKCVETGIVGKL